MARAVSDSRTAPIGGQPPRWVLARRGMARRVRGALGRTRDVLFLPLARTSGLLASLYYAILSSAFWREHAAVLHGRSRYQREHLRASRHFWLLRRNIHRLEKGLVMRPRRSTFAADYIGETVRCYAAIVTQARADPASIDERELHWARDVLGTYFGVVGSGPEIDRARAAWASLGPVDLGGSDAVFAPYQRDLSGPPAVSYEALADLSKRRRSVRWYLPKPVPRELVDQAIEVAAQAPSACNRQPFEFRIVDDPALVAQVSRIPGGTGGFAHNLPALAVIVGKLGAFPKERDRHLIYIDGALAAMAFIYALESLGLASCSINWPDQAREERLIRRTLALEPDERVVMLISFGYPDPSGMVPYSAKTPLDVLRRFN